MKTISTISSNMNDRVPVPLLTWSNANSSYNAYKELRYEPRKRKVVVQATSNYNPPPSRKERAIQAKRLATEEGQANSFILSKKTNKTEIMDMKHTSFRPQRVLHSTKQGSMRKEYNANKRLAQKKRDETNNVDYSQLIRKKDAEINQLLLNPHKGRNRQPSAFLQTNYSTTRQMDYITTSSSKGTQRQITQDAQEYIHYLKTIDKQPHLLLQMIQDKKALNSSKRSKRTIENKYLTELLKKVTRRVDYISKCNDIVSEEEVMNLLKEEADKINANVDKMIMATCFIKNFSLAVKEGNELILLPLINSIHPYETFQAQAPNESTSINEGRTIEVNKNDGYSFDNVMLKGFQLNTSLKPINEKRDEALKLSESLASLFNAEGHELSNEREKLSGYAGFTSTKGGFMKMLVDSRLKASPQKRRISAKKKKRRSHLNFHCAMKKEGVICDLTRFIPRSASERVAFPTRNSFLLTQKKKKEDAQMKKNSSFELSFKLKEMKRNKPNEKIQVHYKPSVIQVKDNEEKADAKNKQAQSRPITTKVGEKFAINCNESIRLKEKLREVIDSNSNRDSIRMNSVQRGKDESAELHSESQKEEVQLRKGLQNKPVPNESRYNQVRTDLNEKDKLKEKKERFNSLKQKESLKKPKLKLRTDKTNNEYNTKSKHSKTRREPINKKRNQANKELPKPKDNEESQTNELRMEEEEASNPLTERKKVNFGEESNKSSQTAKKIIKPILAQSTSINNNKRDLQHQKSSLKPIATININNRAEEDENHTERLLNFEHDSSDNEEGQSPYSLTQEPNKESAGSAVISIAQLKNELLSLGIQSQNEIKNISTNQIEQLAKSDKMKSQINAFRAEISKNPFRYSRRGQSLTDSDIIKLLLQNVSFTTTNQRNTFKNMKTILQRLSSIDEIAKEQMKYDKYPVVVDKIQQSNDLLRKDYSKKMYQTAFEEVSPLSFNTKGLETMLKSGASHKTFLEYTKKSRLNEFNMHQELQYQIESAEGENGRARFRDFLSQLDNMKSMDGGGYIHSLEQHYDNIKEEIDGLVQAKEMEERLNRFLNVFAKTRTLINVKRSSLNDKIKVKDFRFDVFMSTKDELLNESQDS